MVAVIRIAQLPSPSASAFLRQRSSTPIGTSAPGRFEVQQRRTTDQPGLQRRVTRLEVTAVSCLATAFVIASSRVGAEQNLRVTLGKRVGDGAASAITSRTLCSRYWYVV